MSDIHFIGRARGSVEEGQADLAAKAAADKLHHFVVFTEDTEGNYEYRLWGKEMSLDRLLRYAEELRLWAIKEMEANRKPKPVGE